MAEEPVEVVRKLNDAFNAFDVDAVIAPVYVIRDGKAISAKFEAAQ
jgi:hypothetical protein